jgi:lipopolysaccharide export system protein LptA
MTSLPKITAIALALLAAGPAAAQLAPNSHAPLDVAADELEVANAQCVAIWRGDAEALQDTARLRADVLKIFSQPKAAKTGEGRGACGDTTRMEAHGSVYYVTPQQRVRGDDAVYEAASETLTMTGDVVAVQGQNVLRGSRMVVNTQTGEGQMQGGGRGRNGKDRPRGVFYPSQTQTPATKPVRP